MASVTVNLTGIATFFGERVQWVGDGLSLVTLSCADGIANIKSTTRLLLLGAKAGQVFLSILMRHLMIVSPLNLRLPGGSSLRLAIAKCWK